MMIDKYTKAVLTVIAAALICLIAKEAVAPAKSGWSDCGSDINHACWIVIKPF